MATLKQLQARNKKLRKVQVELNEIEKTNQEIARLTRENKQLAFRAKHPKAAATSRRIVKTTAKFGVKAFKGLQRYGRRLAEAERREQARNRTLKRQVKKTKTRKKK